MGKSIDDKTKLMKTIFKFDFIHLNEYVFLSALKMLSHICDQTLDTKYEAHFLH